MKKSNRMRLLSLLCLLLCAVLLFSACDGGTGEPVQTDGQTEETTEADVTPPNGEQPPQTSNKATYTVKVQTSEGGLEGVRVQACKGELCLAPVMTNASGIATISLDKSENISDYHIKINKFPTGYAGSLTQEFAFASGTTSLTITLSEYKLEVSDMFAGVANVRIKISAENTEVAAGKTNTHGELIFLLTDGTYSASVEVPDGYQLTTDANLWELTAQQRSATIYLVGGNTTINKTVTVKDHNGSPKAGATVSIWAPGSASALETKTTNADGQVTFENLNNLTNYRVVVAADGIVKEAEFASFAATSLEVTLSRPVAATEQTYKVTVKDASGTPYTDGVTVSLVYYDSINKTFTVKMTAATQNGDATFTLIPEQNGFYYASIAAADLPVGYELTGAPENLFPFDEALKAEVSIRPIPTYGTEAEPARWVNFANVTNNPFYPVNNQLTLELTAGQTYYVLLSWSSGMQMTVTGDVTVTYNGETYSAGDTIIFAEESPMQGNEQAVIAVTSVNGGTVTLTTAEYTEESNENDTEEGLTVAPNDDEDDWGVLIPFN